jgi:hypothetical protein
LDGEGVSREREEMNSSGEETRGISSGFGLRVMINRSSRPRIEENEESKSTIIDLLCGLWGYATV